MVHRHEIRNSTFVTCNNHYSNEALELVDIMLPNGEIKRYETIQESLVYKMVRYGYSKKIISVSKIELQ